MLAVALLLPCLGRDTPSGNTLSQLDPPDLKAMGWAPQLPTASLAEAHLEDIHMAEELVKQTERRVASLLSVRQLAWTATRGRLAAGDAGAGELAHTLLNEETSHMNQIENNLSLATATLEHQRRVANLTRAAFAAQNRARNASYAAMDAKEAVARTEQAAAAAATMEGEAKQALKAEEAAWLAKQNRSGALVRLGLRDSFAQW